MMKDLGYYRGLPYEREWLPRDDESGRYFVVRLREIPEIYGTGFTRQAALAALNSAFDDQIMWCLDMGVDVPEPNLVAREPTRMTTIAMVKVVPHAGAPVARQTKHAGPVTRTAAIVESYRSSEPIEVGALERVA
jgi:predicted RNase H-like HicB family nuclease